MQSKENLKELNRLTSSLACLLRLLIFKWIIASVDAPWLMLLMFSMVKY